MKIGVVFPQTEIGNDPVIIRDFAQAVEGMGFNHLLVYDHVLGADRDRPGGFEGPYDRAEERRVGNECRSRWATNA